jgi:hypothetical protein
MVERTWRYYHTQWKKWGDRVFIIANSLHKFPPHGRNPVTKKKYASSKSFIKALRHAESRQAYYKKMTKKKYKESTGRNW